MRPDGISLRLVKQRLVEVDAIKSSSRGIRADVKSAFLSCIACEDGHLGNVASEPRLGGRVRHDTIISYRDKGATNRFQGHRDIS